MKNMRSLLIVRSIEGYRLRDLPRILWAVLRFRYRFNQATPEQQENILAFLAASPGVTVIRHDH
jgi:hypothetical protein